MRAVLWGLLFAGMSATAAWSDAASESATALKYAYLGAQSDKITDVHANLHRAVNCLVGPKDSLFDAGEPNPCAKTGNGAIADAPDAARKKLLQDAVDLAEMGIASSDLEKSIMLATGAAGAIRASQARRQ